MYSFSKALQKQHGQAVHNNEAGYIQIATMAAMFFFSWGFTCFPMSSSPMSTAEYSTLYPSMQLNHAVYLPQLRSPVCSATVASPCGNFIVVSQ